ncbi:nuclear fragile X mental retardation-interacting protein 1-domain-containing protein [Auriculariales sp. MPI-PUGE-AT-0066]|nr:nuclear fragile X mental retardation-interacting protein 1-domain-containing protein [Auriculariales sp. MPI-PUGE-AT-0066]
MSRQPVPSSSRLPAHAPAANPPNSGAAAAQALRNALSNPYANAMQQQQQQQQFRAPQVLWPQANSYGVSYVTPEGYSISSAYNPMRAVPQQQPQQQPAAPHGRGASHLRGRGAPRGRPQHSSPYSSGVRDSGYQTNYGAGPSSRTSYGNSYGQGGGSRCTHSGCSFAGSAKTVEIHMMDRHLIYPPGYMHKKKGDWDADPALNNGKPVPIPGTGITLDTPEALATWIAERKKRWPTTQRVADKKQKLEDAIARGDLLVNDKSRKRKRTDDGEHPRREPDFARGRGRGRGRGGFDRGRPGRGRGGFNPNRVALPPTEHLEIKSAASVTVAKSLSNNEDSDSDSDGDSSTSSSSTSDSDMDPILDAVSSKRPADLDLDATEEALEVEAEVDLECEGLADEDPHATSTSLAGPPAGTPLQLAQGQQQRKRPRQPRPPPPNPFALSSRPSLLHKARLLFTEIRGTVSNLSQAIRFAVQNDFFDGVELKPGDADLKLIEVIDNQGPDGAAHA